MNSQHQLWSSWMWTVTPERTKWTMADIQSNLARFASKCFGHAGQMRVASDDAGTVEIRVRVEGHPVHDPDYVQHVQAAWERFLLNGFGQQSRIQFSAKLEAGDAQDGRPRDQLIILPTLMTTATIGEP